MDAILTIFFFILIIGVLVFVHELGHFLAAKLCKVEVKEFAIGFGKNLVSREYKGTKYSINLIPLGGFVSLEGESDSTSPRSFRNQRFRVKALILVAGVFMNMLFAVVLLNLYLATNNYRFSILPNIVSYDFSGTSNQQSLYPLKVVGLAEDGTAYGVLEENDIIVSINDVKFESYSQFRELLSQNQNKVVKLGILNIDDYSINQKELLLDTPNPETGSILEASFSQDNTLLPRQTYFLKYPSSVTAGVSLAYDIFVYQLKALGSIIGNAFATGNFTEVTQSVGGLPAVTNQVGQIVQLRVFEILLPLSAFISISLATFNILPFPALDGGQLLFSGIEKIRGKKIPDRVLNWVNTSGFVILIGFAILVNVKDIVSLGWLNSIGDFFRNITGR